MHASTALPIVVLHVVASVKPAACSQHCLLASRFIMLVPLMVVLDMQSRSRGGG